MLNVMDKLEAAKNVEFKAMHRMEEYGQFVDCYTLTEPSADVWNAKAEKINTRTFIEVHKREPKDYKEVLS